MIGYLGYRAARGQWRMYARSRKVKGGPNTPAAWLFTLDVFAVTGVILYGGTQQWWPQFGSSAIAAAVLSLLLTAVLHPGPSRVTRHYAEADARTRRADLSPAAMRALARHIDNEGEQ
jgi:hypothetical protein